MIIETDRPLVFNGQSIKTLHQGKERDRQDRSLVFNDQSIMTLHQGKEQKDRQAYNRYLMASQS